MALGQGDISAYACEIRLAAHGLVARAKNETTEILLTDLCHGCAHMSKGGRLDGTIASLREDIPAFKYKYDRVMARR